MAASSDDNVYIKRGRKYIPIGLSCHNYIPDGIWYVRHFDSSYGQTNVDHYLQGLYKVGDIPNYIDIPQLCSIHSYVEYVMNSAEFKELMEEEKGASLQQIVSKITALIVNLNKTLKAKENDDNKRPKRDSGSF